MKTRLLNNRCSFTIIQLITGKKETLRSTNIANKLQNHLRRFYVFFFSLKNIYLFIRERDKALVGGGAEG